jgi:plasmid stabilization system protein ParE
MKLRYTRQAVADLFGIADYVRARNPAAAIDVETAVRSTIDLLADFPKLGRDRLLPRRGRRDLDRPYPGR